ncbi:MAG: molybdopterin-guanine dinucleotide biosynthesis protein B [Candidatus Thorarchaeota archaeon]|jgi:molybdopterin-guanine dinucleotide biosynthesis protein B
MMRIFAVSGFSGTGKTTLVEVIVRELVMRGHTVATIKSSVHELSHEQGTDTWRHTQAGASVTLFVRVKDGSEGLRERIGKENLAMLAGHDFLIIEGMKSVDIPRFWCVGENEIVPDEIPTNTQAIVSWSHRSTSGQEHTVIELDRVPELVEIVKEKALDMSAIE